MLAATNFVEHYAHDFHATDVQKDFVKAAMYGGAILGMVVMGSLATRGGVELWNTLGSKLARKWAERK